MRQGPVLFRGDHGFLSAQRKASLRESLHWTFILVRQCCYWIKDRVNEEKDVIDLQLELEYFLDIGVL